MTLADPKCYFKIVINKNVIFEIKNIIRNIKELGSVIQFG